MSDETSEGGVSVQLIGILPTYRRPTVLAGSLEALARQSRLLDRLIVVDNEASPSTSEIVQQVSRRVPAEYVAAAENTGPAGAIAIGMRLALQSASDDDWLVLLDDDDPPRSDDVFESLESFAMNMVRRDARTAGVGTAGGRFDWRRGEIRRVVDAELGGDVSVDYIGGSQFPFVLVAAVRDVGVFTDELFFGFDDLEYGLRLGRAGYRLYCPGDLWLQNRRSAGRLGIEGGPTRRLGATDWRRYYSLRNQIAILRWFGRPAAALRVTLISGFGKPLVGLPRQPALAVRHVLANGRACRDAWWGRMGRTVEPDGGARAGKLVRSQVDERR